MSATRKQDNGATGEISPYPPARWVAGLFAVWFAAALVPPIVVYCNPIGTNAASHAGAIGDSFGLANSFFSAAALLFVIWSMRLQQRELTDAQKEWQANTQAQAEQAQLMRQAAHLTAANHIYNHYGEDYGGDNKIRQAIANGHRRWAIRESFDSFDEVFEADRVQQVKKDFEQLVALLALARISEEFFCKVAVIVSSLLVDTRMEPKCRKTLWPLYELLRGECNRLTDADSTAYDTFLEAAGSVVCSVHPAS